MIIINKLTKLISYHLQENNRKNVLENSYQIAEKLNIKDVYKVYDSLLWLEMNGFLKITKPFGAEKFARPVKPLTSIQFIKIIPEEQEKEQSPKQPIIEDPILSEKDDNSFQKLTAELSTLTDQQINAILALIKAFKNS